LPTTKRCWREPKKVPCTGTPGKFAAVPLKAAESLAASRILVSNEFPESPVIIQEPRSGRIFKKHEGGQSMLKAQRFKSGARKLLLGFAVLPFALAVAGCSHRLVASDGEHTVKIFPNQETYDKVEKMKSQTGPIGMLGGIGADLAARSVDDRTPVRIVSSNDEGSTVEVTDGPFKGTTGFVPKQNVD